MNYLEFFQKGKKIHFIEKDDPYGPKEIDSEDWPSAEELGHAMAYMVPFYGTYLSVNDAIENPTWYNIGTAALSGLSDIGTLAGVGLAGKAAIAASRASKLAKVAKGAEKAAYTTKAATKTIDAQIRGAEAGGNAYLKGVINTATHGETPEKHKDGSTIHIKKKNRGKFTDYCGGEVTEECIERGKHSSNPTTRKRATFAANARTWKHLEGGKVFFLRAYNKFANGDIKQALNEFMSTPTVEATDDTTPYITGVSNDFSGYTISDPTITSSGMRGMRNNNPGNIRISDNDWKGKRTNNTDGSFELFDSMAYGYRALFKLIKTYYNKYNLRTPRQIFLKYAPSADSNDPTKYASIVALTMGISPDTPIDINNQNQMVGLAQAITMVENGGEQGLVDDILEGLRMSNED